MKTILSYFLLVILTVSCQLKPNENFEKLIAKDMSNDDTKECIADTAKATAIFWIDNVFLYLWLTLYRSSNGKRIRHYPHGRP